MIAFTSHPSVAKLFMEKAALERLGDTIYLNSPPLLHPSNTAKISLTVPTTWEIYQAYFTAQGYTIAKSDKLSYAQNLIDMAGGLEGAKNFGSRLAYEILDMLADKASKKLAQELMKQLELKKFSEEDLLRLITETGTIPRFQRKPRKFEAIWTEIKKRLSKSERASCLRTLSELVRIKAVQRGMFIKCPHCQTTLWYGIYVLDERLKCLGCLESFDLLLAENPDAVVDRPFEYSLNPLINRGMDQDVLPVIIALLALRNLHQTMEQVIPGLVLIESSGKPIGDFDFAYVYKHELYGGECKAGSYLKDNDFEMVHQARSLGFRAFFFATTATFGDKEEKRITSLQQELDGKRNESKAFDLFVLDGPILFGDQLLPPEIPH